MCGRYLILSPPEAFRRLFGYPQEPNFPARYNVAPTQPVPIVRVVEGEREFALVRWGLIPAWVKDPRGFSLLVNARAESVNDKPAFRNPMRRRRCLFPADGFYDWKDQDGRKHPYCIRPKDRRPIAFAGLWETWMGPNGEELDTAAIITMPANRELATLHPRILPSFLKPYSTCGSTAAASMRSRQPLCLSQRRKVRSKATRFRQRSTERPTRVLH